MKQMQLRIQIVLGTTQGARWKNIAYVANGLMWTNLLEKIFTIIVVTLCILMIIMRSSIVA